MAQTGRPREIPRNARRIPVPAVALDHWLAEVDDPAELKVALRVVALLGPEPVRGGVPPSVSLDDVLDDGTLRRVSGLGTDESIRNALAGSLLRGMLVAAQVQGDTRIWFNDDRTAEHLARSGFTALEPSAIAGVASLPEEVAAAGPPSAQESRANIFALYETHIGTFGHGMAEQLRAAEDEYPTSWIEEAFSIASGQNVRSWGYVHAILRRWLQEGKPVTSVGAQGTQRERRHDDGEPGHDPAEDSRTGYLESYRRRYGRLPWEPDAAAGEHGDA